MVVKIQQSKDHPIALRMLVQENVNKKVAQNVRKARLNCVSHMVVDGDAPILVVPKVLGINSFVLDMVEESVVKLKDVLKVPLEVQNFVQIMVGESAVKNQVAKNQRNRRHLIAFVMVEGENVLFLVAQR